jgi:hypothetical protein
MLLINEKRDGKKGTLPKTATSRFTHNHSVLCIALQLSFCHRVEHRSRIPIALYAAESCFADCDRKQQTRTFQDLNHQLFIICNEIILIKPINMVINSPLILT